MNAPESIQGRLRRAGREMAPDPRSQRMPAFGMREVLAIARDSWLVMSVILSLSLLTAAAVVTISRPLYEASLLIQVEEPAAPTKSILGEAASGFDTKTSASAEIEIMRSRRILASAVDKVKLFIEAEPRYVPVVGARLARDAAALSTPGILGMGGWVSGAEKIQVRRFDVPAVLEGTKFMLTVQGDGRYSLLNDKLGTPLQGQVGEPLLAQVAGGTLALEIDVLEGKAGAQFRLVRKSYDQTIAQLRGDLGLGERGRLSGVIEASLRDTQPARAVAVLNEIGRNYVQQNSERRAEEADKTLGFLESQLPSLKAQSDAAEEAYNRYRLRKGSISPTEESKLLLERAADVRGQLQAALQKRRELDTRLAANHPDMAAINEQVASLKAQVGAMAGQIRQVPALQQDSGRLERNVKSSSEIYQQMRHSALQLRLLKEGRSGSVRLVDEAWSSGVPVAPRTELIFGGGLLGGAVLAVLFAMICAARRKGLASAYDVESQTGLPVYGVIPKAKSNPWPGRKASRQPGWPALLYNAQRPDASAGALALRNLATTLEFGFASAGRRRFLITAATENVGRSFVAANLAHLFAGAGHRVLLVDADFKGGHLHRHLGMPRTPGLAELLAGTARDDDVLRVVEGTRVAFLSAGETPAGISSLKLMSGISDMMDRFSATFDVVIIAGPPVLQAAETLFLAAAADSIFLVARSEQTQAEEIAECARRLAQSGHEISGVIFNDMDLSKRPAGEFGRVYGNLAYRYGT
ncbi:MAG: exopolysaccharide transport protein family [Frankiales bacterium]|nr:exopolysaccharide transport protein family [Frankiales bacterium]